MEPAPPPTRSERFSPLALIVHPDEHRPRALVRLAITLTLLVVFAIAAGAVWPILRVDLGSEAGRLMIGGAFVAFAPGTLLLIGLCNRFLDRRSIVDLGFSFDRRWVYDLAFGLVLGFVLIGGVMGAERAMGWATYREPVDLGATLAWLPVAIGAFLSVGFYEELVFRGYLVKNTAEGLASPRWSDRASVIASCVITSLVFGLAHAFNQHATWTSTIDIAVAGLMLAGAYALTGQLGLGIGLHVSWNLAQALFGMPVSGGSMFAYAAVMRRDVVGPAWITGGDFGPEAGLTGLAAMLAGLVLIAGWARLTRGVLRTDATLAVYRAFP
ncbi:MAG: lysostaphin resistance A-like protein [Sandaracinaceae bacterium]